MAAAVSGPLGRLPLGRLIVDLGALRANYRLLADLVAPAECGAVIKADGYGLGLETVAVALYEAGARTFFVAQPQEAVRTRQAIADPAARIMVLSGWDALDAASYRAQNLVPVLNTVGDIEGWHTECRRLEWVGPAAIHLDTGMNRLGLELRDHGRLPDILRDCTAARPVLLISHLACADDPSSLMNHQQAERFTQACHGLATLPASLANSSGIFRSTDLHLDLVRPGYALFGGNPTPETANPMATVVTAQARILQVRAVDRGQTVGYGASKRFGKPTKIATVAIGYADGFARSLSNSGTVMIDGVHAPVVGIVSMDLISVDVSAHPAPDRLVGEYAEVFGQRRALDAVASEAGTIGYEILTSIGSRYARQVRDDSQRDAVPAVCPASEVT